MSQASVLRWFHPEATLGGFARNDHRFIFYSRVTALMKPDMTVMDLGAGRGKWANIESGYCAALSQLKGKCKKVIGSDIDVVVLENPLVDEAVVISADGHIPVPDNSLDMVVSWDAFEHVENAKLLSAELLRILKPGGYICVVTPNKWSYFAIGARVIPFKLHYAFIRLLGPGLRKAEDVFPTVYQLNTLGAIRRWFPETLYENHSYIYNGPPAYHGGFLPLAMVWEFWKWLMPSFFGEKLHIFLRRRIDAQS